MVLSAAWGAAFGNLIGDFFGGLGPGDLFGFLANLLYGLVPYAVWEAVTTRPPVPIDPNPSSPRRGEEGVLRPAKTGAGMLAVTSGAPVVPVYISGSGRAWPRGRRFFRPARITVVFGPPLSFDGGRRAGGHRRAQYEAVGREMMAAIARLKDSVAADEARLKPRVHAQIQ